MSRFFSFIFAYYDSPCPIGLDEINKKKLCGCIIHILEIELGKNSHVFVEITIMTKPPIYVPLWDPGFIKFKQELEFFSWMWEEPYNEMLFWQFSNIIIYVKIVGKILDQLLSEWLFSNPGDKDQILVESMGQICPVVLYLFWTLSPGFENNHTFKWWYGIFPTILTYMIMLENCQNNISVYGCSPFQGTKFYSCWNLMNPWS